MAYYYSNYHENPYHYHQNQPYYSNPNYDYYTNQPNYVQYYDTQTYGNLYQQSPTQSLTGYYYHESENPAHKIATVDEPVSNGFAVSHSTIDEKDDKDLEEHSKKHFHGGYNMSETYGKPLPPSDEICYPPTKVEPISDVGNFSYDSIPTPYGKNDQSLELEPKPTNEIIASDDHDQDDGDGDGDSDGDGDGDGKEMIKRQIPYGYGIEALDLCETVFGGYFPCLWKRNQGSYDQSYNGHEICEDRSDYNYWKGTADYLFGNPNPYGGGMPEKGSYGDPVYCYQRHYPQQSLYGQVEYEEKNYSWMSNSRYD